MTRIDKERIVPVKKRDIDKFLLEAERYVTRDLNALRELEILFLNFVEERNLDTDEIYSQGYNDALNINGPSYDHAYDDAKADFEKDIDRKLDARWNELNNKLNNEYYIKGREQAQAYEADKLILENAYVQLRTELYAKIEELKDALLADHARKDKELKMAYLKGDR